MIHHIALAALLHRSTASAPCAAFNASISTAAACGRAQGTIQSLADPQAIAYTFYFLRYNEMPCGAFPTEQEAYVYNMAVADLNADQDITPADRTNIRNALYTGGVTCP